MNDSTHTPLALATLAACLALAGCETMNAAATNPDTAKTRRGAAIGLLSKGDKVENAMIGAAIGGLAGGAIGNYQDRQERKLRAQLAGTGVDVQRIGDNITLTEYNQTVIEVAGHTGSTGPDAYNQQLSERRAVSVIAFMASRGVQEKRRIKVGAGEQHPVASNSTPQGRQLNRRVEITIVPVQARSG